MKKSLFPSVFALVLRLKRVKRVLLDSKWAGLVVVAIAFLAMAAVSWRKWPDVLVDFGLQLYLPWRISQGAVLYRDLHYLAGGPLSQYFNALLFKIFGVSFRTLIFANLAITAALLVLIYRRFLAATDRWTATTICLAIVLVFAFSEYQVVGNYNYIAPYSHELFHGLVLSILAIACLSDWVNKQKLRHVCAAGFCFGLVFLTKPEIFVALAAGVVTAFILFYAKAGRRGFM
ncbi:MAG: glycosyltransferase family 39 protein, partial [Limisphaerales bacterium]